MLREVLLLIDPSVEKDAFIPRSLLPLARRYMRLFFRKYKVAVRPSATHVGTCVLCSFDHAGRIDACVFPAHPSRNYLGRESSSLPRPFPSLLAIRGGAPWIEGGSRASSREFREKSQLRNVCMRDSVSCNVTHSPGNGMTRRGLRCTSGARHVRLRGKREWCNAREIPRLNVITPTKVNFHRVDDVNTRDCSTDRKFKFTTERLAILQA